MLATSTVQTVFGLAVGALALGLPDFAATWVAEGVGVWAVAMAVLVLGPSPWIWRRIPMKASLVPGSLLVGALGSVLVTQPVAASAGVDGGLGLIAATGASAEGLVILLSWPIGQQDSPH